MAIIPRHLSAVVKKRYISARSLYIYGARQTGKTTLARTALPEIPYISLETPDTLLFAQNDPRGFLAQYPRGAVIDEIQRAPDLLSYLQTIIDERNIRFVLTGSQNLLLMQKVSQSLAGRISILSLLPLSKSEIEHREHRDFHTWLAEANRDHGGNVPDIFTLILKGGFPPIIVDPDILSYWFADYIRTYIERDVRQIVNIHDLAAFQKFLGLCAGRSGSLLNIASLSSDTGISETNCRNWLSVLQTSEIIHLLQPYHANFNKRLIKSPKLYFNDTGLLCALLGIKTKEQLRQHPLCGQIFETYALIEIRKAYLNKGEIPRLYFWRDHRGLEVDCIVENDTDVFPIEIKMAQTF
ncbi:MAG: ATP-binding protein, partial [Candidatus Aminicenantes bacterium]|nr:ATP-binding protein [Candidatus Aminicenantes bacterium]